MPPRLAWKRPGLPKDWVRVLERHPDGVAAQPAITYWPALFAVVAAALEERPATSRVHAA